MAVCNVGMSIKCGSSLAFSGIMQKHIQPLLDHVPVAMGHVYIAAAQPGHQNKGQILPAGIGITVSGHLIKGYVGEQLL